MMTPDPRLPRLAVPSAYRLELTPDLESHAFTGTVAIDLEVLSTTDHLVLNAIELDIHTATITFEDEHHVATTALDPVTERLTLTLDDGIAAGPATVHLSFTGTLNDQLHGFYRSTYTDAEGLERTIATTQFQSTDARRCFPCWDEPEYKASFETVLVVDPSHLAIANTAEVERHLGDDGRAHVRFAPTMPMSTYLVAFVVGPLEATEAIDVDGVPVRVVHRPGKAHLTTFALDVARHALGWFSTYYACLLYTSPSPRDQRGSRMPSSA